MMRTTLNRRAILTLGAVLFAAGCGGDSPTGPPTHYDLFIELTKIYVIGDCEAAAGNPGEFAWRAQAQSGTAGAGYAEYETSGFPAEGGALPYSEDASPIVLGGADLSIDGIPADNVNDVLLTFSVVEWDGGTRDANMFFEQASDFVPGPDSRVSPRATYVGPSDDCRLAFEYVSTWTPSS